MNQRTIYLINVTLIASLVCDLKMKARISPFCTVSTKLVNNFFYFFFMTNYSLPTPIVTDILNVQPSKHWKYMNCDKCHLILGA